MTTPYTGLPNGDIDQDSPVTQELLTTLRDDPIAMAEGATGAPVTAAGWHPYNSTLNGTGDGKIYDFAVHGAVASVETPAFDAGYEYMIVSEGVDTGGGSATASIALYRTQAAAYATAFTITPAVNGPYSGYIILPLAQRSLRLHFIDSFLEIHANNTTASATTFRGVVKHTTATAIGKAKLATSGGSFQGGKLYLYRRSLL